MDCDVASCVLTLPLSVFSRIMFSRIMLFDSLSNMSKSDLERIGYSWSCMAVAPPGLCVSFLGHPYVKCMHNRKLLRLKVSGKYMMVLVDG